MSTIDLYYYYLFLIYGKYYKYALFFHVHAIYFLENQLLGYSSRTNLFLQQIFIKNQLLGWLGYLQAANY